MKQQTGFLAREDLQQLISAIIDHGYACIGPQVQDEAIVYAELTSVNQLPMGINAEQGPGQYSLKKTSANKYFNWANGPQAIKPLLFTAREKLWQSSQSASGEISFHTLLPDVQQEIQPMAIFAARACDIAAMKLQDQHFLQQQYIDPYYQSRRENLLIIAVNCSQPAATCFCHSTADGPFAETGFDIALTELQHGFLVSVETEQGQKILEQISLRKHTEQQLLEADNILANASKQQRALPDINLQTQLFNQLTSDAWEQIASQCLSCGNCTSVCPSCFCHSEKDVPELDGKTSAHYREWDSCFNQGHSYIHGITIRAETSQRYRQWLTHKFASWHDQYGRSGCVGCGRCISWCPVGIDVIESIKSVVDAGNE